MYDWVWFVYFYLLYPKLLFCALIVQQVLPSDRSHATLLLQICIGLTEVRIWFNKFHVITILFFITNACRWNSTLTHISDSISTVLHSRVMPETWAKEKFGPVTSLQAVVAVEVKGIFIICLWHQEKKLLCSWLKTKVALPTMPSLGIFQCWAEGEQHVWGRKQISLISNKNSKRIYFKVTKSVMA